MANIFSQAGLAMRGGHDYEMDQQGLEEGRQRISSGQRRAEAESIGLDEARRQTTAAQSMRDAVRNANAGQAGIYSAAASAAQQEGDIESYGKYSSASASADQEGIGRLARDALTGVSPGDAEKAFNQVGTNRILPGSLEYGRDPKTGDIMVKAKKVTGEDLPILNATKYIQMHRKTTKLAPGEVLVPEQGGDPLATNPKQTDLKDRYMTVPEGADLVDLQNPGSSTGKQQASIRKDAGVLDHITKAVYESPGMGALDPVSGKVMPTEEGQKRAVLANQLYLANKNLDPQTIRDISINGKPMMDNQTGKRYIQYKGQIFERATPTGVQMQTTVAAPQPAKPAQQEDKKTEQPKAEKPKDQRKESGPETQRRKEGAEAFNRAFSTDGGKREVKRTQLKEEVNEEFDGRVKRMSREDKRWLREHSGSLSNAQRKAWRDAEQDEAVRNTLGIRQKNGI